jgi:dolichyl-diphosphooligosaccharide--protein glycosyltransferase
VGGLALTLRLATWREVFGDGAVRLVVDGDPYYHLRRARTILATGAIPWRDGWLNYPAGADVPWPPLFDLLLAACAWLVGLGDPSPETIARVAAVVPPVLGLASIAVAAAFAAEVFGPAAGALTGLLLAASPTHVVYSLLGRPDQHVLEILLFTAVALAMARGLGEGRTRPRTVILLGVTIALSFWNWLGSAFTLLVAGVACAVHAVVTSPERAGWGLPAKLLGAGSAIAAALLALSIGAAGRRGPSASSRWVGSPASRS